MADDRTMLNVVEVGGSGGWGLGRRLGKWQFVESWQGCQLLKLCLLEGNWKPKPWEGSSGEWEDERLTWNINEYLF